MRLRCFAATLLAAACVACAHADPITYTLTGTFSGTLGALTFTNDPGTITLTSDTTGTTALGAGFYTNTGGVSSITLGGIGTAIFLSSTFGAESQANGAGFFDIANSFGTGTYDPLLPGYALTAPFSDTAYLTVSFASLSGTSELTSLGSLVLSGDYGSSATFTATSPAVVTTTPEPASVLLLATGIGSVGLLRRRLMR